jgi:protein-disulfide isomerase
MPPRVGFTPARGAARRVGRSEDAIFDLVRDGRYAGRMIARRMLIASLPLALLAAGGCSPARSASTSDGDPKAVVARVDGHAITQKDVDARAAGALQRLRDQEYEARRDALEDLIAERLLESQASAQGLSRDALVKREVEGKVPRPSREEIAAVYEANKDRVGGRTLAEVAPDIERSIVKQAAAERAQAFMTELRSRAKVVVDLPQPRIDVAIPADARVLGPEKAPVTIVEFSDYLCPYCQHAQVVVDDVLGRNPGKVRFVHRDFLLGRPRSMAVARAALCAADQGKFWDYRHGLLARPGDWSDADLVSRATPLGLDRASFQACLASDKHDKTILDSSEQGNKLGVNSTPTFFINGRRLTGARTAEQFQEVIDSELKAGS